MSVSNTYVYAEVDGREEEYRTITFTLESFFVGHTIPGVYYLISSAMPQFSKMVLITEEQKEYELVKASLREVEKAKNKIWVEGDNGVMNGFLIEKRKR